jgi:hypothetical protein
MKKSAIKSRHEQNSDAPPSISLHHRTAAQCLNHRSRELSNEIGIARNHHANGMKSQQNKLGNLALPSYRATIKR